MDKSLLVKKSNKLIEARYKLTLVEQKLVLYIIAKMDKDSEKFNLVQLELNEIINLLGDYANRHSELKETLDGLRQKKIVIFDEEEGELNVGWFASLQYKSGKIEVEFSIKLAPYLLKLSERYTRYYLQNILNFKNKYSIRMYELLKQYQKIKRRKFEIEKLRELLMLDENQYDRFYDFERFILKQTMAEINDLTDLTVNYEKIKKGRKCVAVEYSIDSKEDRSYIDFLEQSYDIPGMTKMMGLENENFDAKQIMDIYGMAVDKTQDQVDVFKYIKINYLYSKKDNRARNVYAYLLKAVEEDYAKAFVQLKMKYFVK